MPLHQQNAAILHRKLRYIIRKTALYCTRNCTILHEKLHYIAREMETKEKEDMSFLTYPPIIDVDLNYSFVAAK